jgi:hypothetical protein
MKSSAPILAPLFAEHYLQRNNDLALAETCFLLLSGLLVAMNRS